MFGLFKNKLKTGTTVVAPATGVHMPLEHVTEHVFSQKNMGDGFAVHPTHNTVVAPVAGTLSTVFPTKTAIGLTTPSGLDVLVQLGLDTVQYTH